MARLIPSATGAMDAAMFERLGSLEKSMILYRPEVLVPVDQLEGAVCEAFCDKRREYSIIKTLVASLNGCRYCLGGVVQGLRSATHDEELIRSLIKDPGEAKLSRRERAMVEYATALTLTPRDLSRSYVENLRKAGLSDQEIFDLALMTSWFNMLTRMGPGLGYTLDPQRQLWEKQIYDKDYAAPAEGSCSGGKEWPLPAPKRQPG
jgi:AhpD family alkylhydroperoxidase